MSKSAKRVSRKSSRRSSGRKSSRRSSGRKSSRCSSGRKSSGRKSSGRKSRRSQKGGAGYSINPEKAKVGGLPVHVSYSECPSSK